MKALFQPTAWALVLGAGALATTTAKAGCSWPDLMASAQSAQAATAALKSTAPKDSSASSTQNDDRAGFGDGFDHSLFRAAIVGFWNVTFTAKGNPGIPDDTVIDQGYATWHSDGTELMNSSRPPASGNFCMGVWKQVGRSTFKLNHFALSWDTTGSTLIGPTNIRERVTVDRSGNSYSGTFTIDQFAEDGTTPLGHVEGTISATRITAD